MDALMPSYDVRDRHERPVHASASTAYDALRALDFNDIPIVRVIFALRSFLMSGHAGSPLPSGPFVDTAVAIGWRIVVETPGEELIAAAVTQPWNASVTFRGLDREAFVRFAEPGFVKIAWSMGARPAGAERSVLATETRAVATDDASRRRFRTYWFKFNWGIRVIRRLALAEVARRLERV